MRANVAKFEFSLPIAIRLHVVIAIPGKLFSLYYRIIITTPFSKYRGKIPEGDIHPLFSITIDPNK
jgi:hypothetical protein